jgi:predicted unusual protein kinase regulating ubiquinone biosynthesis (AarF/ABC1/UbiB family)
MLAAKVMTDSGLVQGNAPASSARRKIQKFVAKYMDAEDEQGNIQKYCRVLRDVMRCLQVSPNESFQLI